MSVSNSHGRQMRLPLFALDQTDADFVVHSSSHQDQDDDSEEDEWMNDAASQEFKIEFDHFTDWRYMLQHGGLGRFLYTTTFGQSCVVAVLVTLLWGAGVALVIVNRVIVWGSYLQENYTHETRLMYMLASQRKSPYQLTSVWLQMVISHISMLFMGFAILVTSPWLKTAGLFDTVEETSEHIRTETSQETSTKDKPVTLATSSVRNILAIQPDFIQHTFPLSLLTVFHVATTIISMNYTRLPGFVLARVGMVPISLILASVSSNKKPSRSTLLSVVLASSALGFSTYSYSLSLTRIDCALGLFSSVLGAICPFQISRVYHSHATHHHAERSQRDNTITAKYVITATIPHREDLKVLWGFLNHTSLISTVLFTIIVFCSGELPGFWRDWHHFGIYTYWLMIFMGGCFGCIVLVTTVVLTRLTSPLSTTFVFIPQASLVCPIMLGNRLSSQNWLVLTVCWMSCAWFLKCRLADSNGG